MNDTREENTRWISVWIINDPDFYYSAQDAARVARERSDYSILRGYITGVLRAGSTETVKEVAREMSDADLDNTDWAEVADDLLSE